MRVDDRSCYGGMCMVSSDFLQENMTHSGAKWEYDVTGGEWMFWKCMKGSALGITGVIYRNGKGRECSK
jgi:hypothetical protein